MHVLDSQRSRSKERSLYLAALAIKVVTENGASRFLSTKNWAISPTIALWVFLARQEAALFFAITDSGSNEKTYMLFQRTILSPSTGTSPNLGGRSSKPHSADLGGLAHLLLRQRRHDQESGTPIDGVSRDFALISS